MAFPPQGAGTSYPSARRVLTFVDGTNLLRRMAETIGADYRTDNAPDEALELACFLLYEAQRAFDARARTGRVSDARRLPGRTFAMMPLRTVWVGAARSDAEEQRIARALRREGVEARLVRQHGTKGKEKGVDMAVVRELLVNAFHSNMDIALLVAGDEDYLGVVGDVKRYGVEVWGSAFNSGKSERLELACDDWMPLDSGLGTGEAPKLADKIRKAYPPKAAPTPPAST